MSQITTLDLTSLNNNKIVCLTADIECDFGELLDEPEYEGIKHIPLFVDYFKEKQIPLTCFIQGSLLETHRNFIDLLTELDTEFHLHSFSHPSPDKCNIEYEIKAGKEAYQNYFGHQPKGYRAPLGVIREDDYDVLLREGFQFDSSIFPSFRPGAFNNNRAPVVPFRIGSQGIMEFPFTVLSRWLRVPLSISYIKLLGWPYELLIKKLKLPDIIIIGFHLHDLYDLKSKNLLANNNSSLLYKIIYNKIYIQNKANGLELLDELILLLQRRNYLFFKLTEVYDLLIQ